MQLSHEDWLQLHHLIAAIYAAPDAKTLELLTLNQLPPILPVDYICWNEHGSTLAVTYMGTTQSHAEPLDSRPEELAATISTHPILHSLGMSTKFSLFQGVHALSDFATQTQLKDTAIFHEVYRHAEAHHQLACHVFFAADSGVLLTANSRHPIPKSARFKLDILKTHLSQAGQRLLATKSLNTQLAPHCGQSALNQLTPRERETLPYLLQGKTNPEIAIIFDRSPRTIEKHVAAILEKLGFENRGALMAQTSMHHTEQ